MIKSISSALRIRTRLQWLFACAFLFVWDVQSIAAGVSSRGNLLAHWRFDEAGGTIAHDQTGANAGILSSSGSGFTSEGVSGGALQLTRLGNGYVDLGDVLDFLTNSFSVSGWIRTLPGDTTPVQLIISKHRPGYGNGWYLLVNDVNASGRAAAHVGDSGPDYPISETPVNDGNWHHVVITYALGEFLRLY